MALAGMFVEERNRLSPEDDFLWHHRSIRDKIDFVLMSQESEAQYGST
jgi:hypothetical protein